MLQTSFCSDSLSNSSASAPDSKCRDPCSGDPSSTCGGYFAVQVAAVSDLPPSPPAPPEIPDSRSFSAGVRVLLDDYLDQPYCIQGAGPRRDAWVCIITADSFHEGGAGEHMVSVTSTDHGANWSAPVRIEPNTTLANSYGTVVVTPAGRVYAMYNMNLDNITCLPDGTPLHRTDELGHFVMKYSDDAGATWSNSRYEIPYRLTSLDYANPYKGEVKLMWSVDQVKVHGQGPSAAVFYAFTKIGTPIQNPPQEVFFPWSDNIMSVAGAEEVSWRLLPDGDHGLLPPGGNPNVMEEGHIIDRKAGGWYAIGRTTQGLLASASTCDATPEKGWSPTGFAKYWNNMLTPATYQPPPKPANSSFLMGLKNPRGPITMKRFSN
eukprot:gene2137-3068_t